MTSVLICSTPVHGHVTPLLAVAEHLVAAGHRVRFLTGARYLDAVRATGAEPIGLPSSADFDDSDIDAAFPGRRGRTGVAGVRWDLRQIFLEPARAQLAAVDSALAEEHTDVVLAEAMFFGAMLLLGRPAGRRPVVLTLGIVPLGLRSRDTAPFGLGIPPMSGLRGRVRDALLRVVAERGAFGGLHRDAQRMVGEATGGRLTTHAMDYPSMSDGVVQFTVPEFEYPRSDLRVPVHFVGPVSRGVAPAGVELPTWWSDLSAGRPVVHVTQGTVANARLDDLVLPTFEALADDDVLVVGTTGGRPVPDVPLPANARLAPYLPYRELLPLTDVLVTNGGYGGAHFALEHGVPIVATGSTEDKAEVAARVAWSGAGLRLRPDSSGRIAPSELRDAVRTLLGEPAYRTAAARLGEAIGRSSGVAGLEAIVAALGRPAAGAGSAPGQGDTPRVLD
jgi:UDP:flavonoid glycosyltransferase YjiC (YdhE family)